MNFHHLTWMEVVGYVKAFQNHSFLKMETIRNYRLHWKWGLPISVSGKCQNCNKVEKFNNVKSQAIVQDILLWEKYVNMIWTWTVSFFLHRLLQEFSPMDIHPQIIPGICMMKLMKLPCVATVQWVRRPPTVSPKVHLWNPHSYCNNYFQCKQIIWSTCGKKTILIHQMMLRGGNVNMPILIIHPSSYETQQNLGRPDTPPPMYFTYWPKMEVCRRCRGATVLLAWFACLGFRCHTLFLKALAAIGRT